MWRNVDNGAVYIASISILMLSASVRSLKYSLLKKKTKCRKLKICLLLYEKLTLRLIQILRDYVKQCVSLWRDIESKQIHKLFALYIHSFKPFL